MAQNPHLDAGDALAATLGLSNEVTLDAIRQVDAARYIAKILDEGGAADRADEVVAHLGIADASKAAAFKTQFVSAAAKTDAPEKVSG